MSDHTVVFVVEVTVPDEYEFSATHDAAQAVMAAVRTQTALPCRAWVSIGDTAAAVLVALDPTPALDPTVDGPEGGVQPR